MGKDATKEEVETKEASNDSSQIEEEKKDTTPFLQSFISMMSFIGIIVGIIYVMYFQKG